MQVAAALVWPMIALVFTGVFAGLWNADRARTHLLGFFVGFLTLAIAMTTYIAFPSLDRVWSLPLLHALACTSVIAIVWGATSRLSQRIPIGIMVTISLLSCVLLSIALQSEAHSVTLLLQNGTSGLLFGMGAMALWVARPANLLDRMLVWTLGMLAGFSLLRPLWLLFLHVEIGPLIERKQEVAAVNVLVLTLLTAALGMILFAIAIKEALEIRHRASRSDPVSGFLDSTTFERACDPALTTAHRLAVPACLVVIELDWFDAIMEKWGAETCDLVIREIADVVRASQRDSDIVGRIWENRFALLLVGVGPHSALKIATKLREEVDRACNDSTAGLLKFTLSCSIAQASVGADYKKLLRDTLSPLTDAPKLGGNTMFVSGNEVQTSELGAHEHEGIIAHG